MPKQTLAKLGRRYRYSGRPRPLPFPAPPGLRRRRRRADLYAGRGSGLRSALGRPEAHAEPSPAISFERLYSRADKLYAQYAVTLTVYKDIHCDSSLQTSAARYNAIISCRRRRWNADIDLGVIVEPHLSDRRRRTGKYFPWRSAPLQRKASCCDRNGRVWTTSRRILQHVHEK